ncbi:MAG: peptide chain release factor 2 [Bacilli bacterium]
MENYEINKHIEDFSKRIADLKQAINVEKLSSDLKENEKLLNNPNFWNDQKTSAKVLREIKEQKDKIVILNNLEEKLEEIELYFDIYKTEDEDVLNDIIETINSLTKSLEDFEIKILLSNEYDSSDAIFEMHPGAGGTESQDWCEMLFRMYKRYCEKNGFDIEVLDYISGEEAGIKSVSFIVKGEKAYGFLKSENGVHRLVRISPFDSNSRRHTSFCAVTVYPSMDNDVNIDIKPDDIRVDTYRSSGAGGQSVNTTDSAIRITHIKTGLVVTCQNERSQIQNREKAMQILKSKLYQLEIENQEKKLKNVTGDVSENSFGSQIRSYVFHPYSMIKDHRTNYEVFNVTPVMDGEIDEFINAYLKSPYNKR